MKAKDLLGRKFGHLLVITRVGTKKTPNNTYKPLWECQCSCGKKVKRTSESLLRSSRTKGKFTSCGCQRFALSQSNGKRNKGRTKPGTAKRDILCMYKHAAKKRGMSWELSDEEFFKITKSPCFYTGWLPDNVHKTQSGNEIYIYNGIDRLDSSKGYTKDNCVPCHKIVNRMKSDLTYDEFIRVIRAIINKIDVAIGPAWEKA